MPRILFNFALILMIAGTLASCSSKQSSDAEVEQTTEKAKKEKKEVKAAEGRSVAKMLESRIKAMDKKLDLSDEQEVAMREALQTYCKQEGIDLSSTVEPGEAQRSMAQQLNDASKKELEQILTDSQKSRMKELKEKG